MEIHLPKYQPPYLPPAVDWVNNLESGRRIEAINKFAKRFDLFRGWTKKQVETTANFWAQSCFLLPKYVDFLEQNSALTAAAIELQRGDQNRGLRHPQFSHSFYSGYLLFELSPMVIEGLRPQEGLVHDLVKFRRRIPGKSAYSYLDLHRELTALGLHDGDELREAVTMAHLLLPDEGRWEMSSNFFRDNLILSDRMAFNFRYQFLYQNDQVSSIHKAKELNFRLREMMLVHLAANLRETVVDITNGVGWTSGQNGYEALRHLQQHFAGRIELIKRNYDAKHPLLNLFESDMNRLNNKVKELS